MLSNSLFVTISPFFRRRNKIFKFAWLSTNSRMVSRINPLLKEKSIIIYIRLDVTDQEFRMWCLTSNFSAEAIREMERIRKTLLRGW